MFDFSVIASSMALFSIVAGYSYLFNKKLGIELEFAPAYSVSLIIIVLYVSGIFNHLLYWSNGIILVGMILFLCLIRDFFKERKIDPTYFILFILFFLISVSLSTQTIIYDDDFTHWALSSLDMYHTESLSTEKSRIALLDYPQGTSLYHFLSLKIYDAFNIGFNESTRFSESVILIANNTLFAMLSLPLIVMAYRRNKILSFLTFLCFLFLMMSIYNMTEITLNVDIIVSGVFGIILILWVRHRDNAILYIAPFVSVLPLLKVSGMFFCFILIFIFTMTIMRNISYFSKYIGVVMFLLMMPIMVQSTLNFHKEEIGISSTFDIGVKISEVERVVESPSYHELIIIHNFIDKFSISYINTSSILIFIIISISLFVVLLLRKYYKKDIAIILSSLFIGFFVYILGLLSLYLFSFPFYESVEITSIERCLHIYILGWMFLLIYLSLNIKIQNDKESGRIIFGLLFLMSLSFSLFSNNFNYFDKRLEYLMKTNQAELILHKYSDEIKKVDRIYIISNDFGASVCNAVRYKLYPARVNYTFNRKNGLKDAYSFLNSCNISLDKKNNINFSRIASIQEWSDDLTNNYDLLMIYSYSDTFINEFGSMFENRKDIGLMTMFKISVQSGKVILTRVHENKKTFTGFWKNS